VSRLACERPGHSATTAHLCAAYPFIADGGRSHPGVYIGRDAYGGDFTYDPWLLHPDPLPGPNMLILGGIASHKSGLVKTYGARQILHGRQFIVIDVKGEYRPLGEWAGIPPFSLRPGGDLRLNPIDRRIGRDGQLSLLRSVTGEALGRDLAPEEDAGLRVALDEVNAACADREPTLPDVVEVLLHPREAMVAGVSATSAEDLAVACRQAALALQRLCVGDLRGMFDGKTSPGLDFQAPLVVLDLSAVRDHAAVGILVTCAGAFLQGMLAERKRAAEEEGAKERQVILVVEEGWRLTGHVGAAEWMRENWKLCRGWGIQNIIVVHRLSDLGASGDEGSREARIADGLLSDADTKVIYRQAPDQVPALRSRLGMSATEAEIATDLRAGEAVWMVGRRSFLVSHRVSAAERRLVYTGWRMGESHPRTV
jgi:hypothetical protein